MQSDGLKLMSTTSILENTRIESGSLFPTNPTEKQLFYLTTDIDAHNLKGLYVRESSSWNSVVTLPNTSVSSGTNFPALPSDNELFYLSSGYSTFVAGLYKYSNSDSAWHYATSSAYTAENAANKNTPNGYAGLDSSNRINSNALPDNAVTTSMANVPNGYAGLDANNKIIASHLPSIAITDTFVVSTQAAMLLLSAQTGDIAIRTDLSKSFVLSADNATVLTNWKELQTPTDAVLSVNGQTGAVVIDSPVTSVNNKTGAVVVVSAGDVMPSSPADKDLFFLTADYGAYRKGMHYYNSNAWAPAFYSSNTPYDIGGYFPGIASPGAVMLMFATPAGRPFTIPANFAGSIAKSLHAPTANAVYYIQKNSIQVATITFATGSNVGEFSIQPTLHFADGDVFSVIAPTPSDNTHADIVWTFIANLS